MLFLAEEESRRPWLGLAVLAALACACVLLFGSPFETDCWTAPATDIVACP